MMEPESHINLEFGDLIKRYVLSEAQRQRLIQDVENNSTVLEELDLDKHPKVTICCAGRFGIVTEQKGAVAKVLGSTIAVRPEMMPDVLLHFGKANGVCEDRTKYLFWLSL